MNLIFLYGLPGVGKLTVARELSNLTDFKLFHNHLTVDLVATLFDFGSESFINLREKIWLETFSEAIKANFTGLIFTFAPENTVPNDFPDKVKNLLEENGGKVTFVELKCELEELEQRLTNSSRDKFGKLNSLELFRQLNSQGVFDTPKITADFSVDTTNLSPTETAKKILNHIGT
ncbi:MAG: AAA family ATPase [Acidobacteriota bacterium]